MKLTMYEAALVRPALMGEDIMIMKKREDGNPFWYITTATACKWDDVMFWAYLPTAEDVEAELW